MRYAPSETSPSRFARRDVARLTPRGRASFRSAPSLGKPPYSDYFDGCLIRSDIRFRLTGTVSG